MKMVMTAIMEEEELAGLLKYYVNGLWSGTSGVDWTGRSGLLAEWWVINLILIDKLFFLSH